MVAVALVALVYVYYPLALPIRFESEEIEIRVDGADQMRVNAQYDLRNLFPIGVAFAFEYPFPGIVGEDIAVVSVADENGEVSWVPRGTRIAYRLRWKSHELKRLKVVYEQRTRTRGGQYILRTTRQWRIPLGNAIFRMEGPGEFSYKMPGEPWISARGSAVEIRHKFYPNEDLLLRW